MYDEKTVSRMQQELTAGVEEIEGENPEIESGFEVDLAVGIALKSGLTYAASRETVHEFFRREIGYVPQQYIELRG